MRKLQEHVSIQVLRTRAESRVLADRRQGRGEVKCRAGAGGEGYHIGQKLTRTGGATGAREAGSPHRRLVAAERNDRGAEAGWRQLCRSQVG